MIFSCGLAQRQPHRLTGYRAEFVFDRTERKCTQRETLFPLVALNPGTAALAVI